MLMTHFIDTTGLTDSQIMEAIPHSAEQTSYFWLDSSQIQLRSDIDDFFSEFDNDPEFREGMTEAGNWIADAFFDNQDTLKTLRLKKGLTQSELARMVGMQQPQLARYENEPSLDPKLSTLLKLSDALDVTLDQLARIISNKDATQ